MSNQTKQNEQLERYLAGKMEGDEKTAFQFELMTNPDLKKDLDTFRTMQKSLAAERNHPNLNFRIFQWLILLAIFFLGVFAFYYLKSSEPTAPKPTEPAQENRETIRKDLPVAEIGKPNPIAEEKIISDKEEDIPSPEKKELASSMESFQPNDYLENFIGSGLRNQKGFEIEIISPAIDEEKISNNGNIFLDLRIGYKSEKGKNLTLHVFSNKESDFNNFLPKHSAEIQFGKSKEQKLVFEDELKLEVPPGLYYITLETDDDMVAVSKFIVR